LVSAWGRHCQHRGAIAGFGLALVSGFLLAQELDPRPVAFFLYF
jgi:hypothetical protein